MYEPGTPHTGPECRAALLRLVAEGRTCLGALPLDVFFAPQGAHWSPAGHVRHLRKSTSPLARALGLPAWVLRLRFGRAVRPSRGFLELRDDYRRALAAGGEAGPFAPRPEAASGDPARRRTEILAAWHGATRDLDAAAARWSEAALDRTVLPHPLLGPLTAREMLAFTVYHTSHHLARIVERGAACREGPSVDGPTAGR